MLNSFFFVFLWLGLAIRSGNLVPFAFPSIGTLTSSLRLSYGSALLCADHILVVSVWCAVWKALVSEEITTDDVRAMDLLSFRIVNEIEGMLQKKSLTPEVFNSVMADMKFEVTLRTFFLFAGRCSFVADYLLDRWCLSMCFCVCVCRCTVLMVWCSLWCRTATTSA